MRPDRTVLAALTLSAALAVVSGCARPAASAGPGAGNPGPVASPSTPACTNPPTGPVRVTEADSGRTVCLSPGTQLNVLLHGSADRRWAPLGAGLPELVGSPNGEGTLVVGVTGGFYKAASPGTVRLTSQRPACPGQVTGGGSPGPGPCAAQEFTLTVVVS